MKRGWIGIIFHRNINYGSLLNAIAIFNFAADVMFALVEKVERGKAHASKILPFDKKIICAIVIL